MIIYFSPEFLSAPTIILDYTNFYKVIKLINFMNRITKEGKYVLGCMVRDMDSIVTTSDGGSTRWVRTELEFEGGIEYHGKNYDRLEVLTRIQPANTVPVESYIRNGQDEIDSRLGDDALISHIATLERLIRIYKVGE